MDLSKLKKVEILQKLNEHETPEMMKDLRRLRKDELMKVLDVHLKKVPAQSPIKKVSKTISEPKPKEEPKPKPKPKPKPAAEPKQKVMAKTQAEIDIVNLASISKQLSAKRRKVNRILQDAFIKRDVEGRILELEKLKKEIINLRHLKHNAAGRKEHAGLIERQEANKMQKKIDDIILGKKPSENITDKDDFIPEDVQNIIEAVPDNSNIMDQVILSANKTNNNIPN